VSWLSKQLEQGGWAEVARETGDIASKPKQWADSIGAFFGYLGGATKVTEETGEQKRQSALMYILIGVAVLAFYENR